MRHVRLSAPAGLENLKLVEEDPPSKPKRGELLVKIRACSLNFHDYMVALGRKPSADGRIPLSDGAGEVVAVGDDAHEFNVGDSVVSTYWPYWLGGESRSQRYFQTRSASVEFPSAAGQIKRIWFAH